MRVSKPQTQGWRGTLRVPELRRLSEGPELNANLGKRRKKKKKDVSY